MSDDHGNFISVSFLTHPFLLYEYETFQLTFEEGEKNQQGVK